jgi:hypothetical protein
LVPAGLANMLLSGGWGPHGNSGVGVRPPGITSTPSTQLLSKRPLTARIRPDGIFGNHKSH